MKTIKVEDFPCWALCYVINGDATGITEEEQTKVDNYLEEIRTREQWKYISVCVEGDVDEYFSAFPEFGLACDCTDVIIYGE